MAKKVEGYIKLQIPAGKATPAPPVGPALGPNFFFSSFDTTKEISENIPAAATLMKY